MRQYITHSQRKTKSKFLFKNHYLTYLHAKIKLLAIPLLDFFCIIGLNIPPLFSSTMDLYVLYISVVLLCLCLCTKSLSL